MSAPDADPAQPPHLVITRVFDAPRDLVYRAWIEPERLMQWWGPKEFTCPHARVDARVGGLWLACMQWPSGEQIWSRGIFEELIPGEKIVTVGGFSDEHGNPSEPDDAHGEFPREIRMTVTFADEDGKTRMTIEQSLPEPLARRVGAYEGWGSSLDKLAASLQR